MNSVAEVARAILYQGFILWPYRRSVVGNRPGWTFGGVFPEPYGRARGEDDAWQMQTECLVEGDVDASVDVHLAFLHAIERRVAGVTGAGNEWVESFYASEQRRLASDEATERQILALRRRLGMLQETEYIPIGIPAGDAEEWLTDASGARLAVITRRWEAIDGMLELSAARVRERLFRVRARVVNRTAWDGERSDEALHHAFVSAHTILRVDGGRFVSLVEPPESMRAEAAACRNIGTRPVLAGEVGSRDTMLSAPIILDEYPRLAPENTGGRFDSCEIDERFVLAMLTRTDELRGWRGSDPWVREMLEQFPPLSPEQVTRLRGVIRSIDGTGDS